MVKVNKIDEQNAEKIKNQDKNRQCMETFQNNSVKKTKQKQNITIKKNCGNTFLI